MNPKFETFKQRSFPLHLGESRQVGKIEVKEFADIKLDNTLDIPIRYCEHSNIAFLEDCPTKESYQYLYGQGHYRKDLDSGNEILRAQKSIGRVKRIRRVLGKTRLAIPDQPNILEIGCGHGYNVSRFSKQVGGKPYGIEPSPICVESCKQNKVRIVGTDIDDLHDHETHFHIILSVHSLEHLVDPDKVIEKLGRLARPGMILLLEVPDLEVSMDIHLNHPFCYSERGTFLLLNEFGFKVASINSRKYDRKQVGNLDVAAVYVGEKKVVQDDVIPKPMALEDLLVLQEKLQIGKRERWLRKAYNRYAITLKTRLKH